MRRITGLLLLLLCTAVPSPAQSVFRNVMDYGMPREYEIGGLVVTGCVTRDANAVKLFTDLQVGDKVMIPGEKIGDAIRNIWRQKLFSDVRIEAAEVRGGVIFLNIVVQENPQIHKVGFRGISKSDMEKLQDIVKNNGAVGGRQIDDALLTNCENAIKRFYVDKGFLKVSVATKRTPVDSSFASSIAFKPNSEILDFVIARGPRVRIADVEFNGNVQVSDARLRRAMKNTRRKRWTNPFGGSKFIWADFRADQDNVVAAYNEEGYRNAQVTGDTMYFVSDSKVRVEVDVHEDRRFYFRNIRITGNSKYTGDTLYGVLDIKRGDPYNKKQLDSRLYMNPNGRDVSSLYMDKGYLSFRLDPAELVDGDSIDLDIRIHEGRQFRVRNVWITGNTKTNEHVIRREIRTKPGDLFDRSDVIRTQRELAQLGYFDPEAMDVKPQPEPRTGMVDLEYIVAEKPSDRLELSGGFGAGRLVLSLGVSFTNFSIRKFFQKEAWSPLPAGDGQTLNLRAVTNGAYYQQYSFSFIEPWLGGRKPNNFSSSIYWSRQTNGVTGKENPLRQELDILGVTVGFGRRLQVPDDYFILRYGAGYQNYQLDNWTSLFTFSNGTSKVITLNGSLSRNSVDAPFFARSGSDVTFSVKLTPPWTALGLGPVARAEDPSTLSDADRYAFPEFMKYKLTMQWFTRLTRAPKSGYEAVLMTRAGFGFLTKYRQTIAYSPFERFYMGGVPLSGFSLDGREIIYLRGYEDFSISNANGPAGDLFIAKYAAEVRFPISLNPQATIYALGFFEAGNSWNSIQRFDPFRVYKSAGLGLRLFLPMFGPMGLDYGWRLDDVLTYPGMNKGQFHFTIGIDLGEL